MQSKSGSINSSRVFQAGVRAHFSNHLQLPRHINREVDGKQPHWDSNWNATVGWSISNGSLTCNTTCQLWFVCSYKVGGRAVGEWESLTGWLSCVWWMAGAATRKTSWKGEIWSEEDKLEGDLLVHRKKKNNAATWRTDMYKKSSKFLVLSLFWRTTQVTSKFMWTCASQRKQEESDPCSEMNKDRWCEWGWKARQRTCKA